MMHFRTDRRQKRTTVTARLALSLLTGALFAAPMLIAAGPALALSEIGREDLPPPGGTPGANPSAPTVPMPGALDGDQPEDGDEDGRNSIARPEIDENAPLPEIMYNLDRLPEPVRRMHDRLVEAAKTGDIEKLRPFLGLADDQTMLSFGEIDGDPIAFLKGLSGDSEGQELLAILEEVLGAGFVHLDAGESTEIYVWPYFFGIPLDKLDNRQKVELFKIVTAGDLEDMKQFGTYLFYRVGITPEGRWAFFVAGE